MKLATRKLTAVMLGALMILTACAAIGPPLPPSLELPKPPSDLRAVRKGDRVTLTWTVPTSTTDRQTIRALGTTRVCRGVAGQLPQCGTPVGEVAATAHSVATSSSQQKSTATYTDVIPAAVVTLNLEDKIAYSVEVLNTSGRGAGVSNVVRVPAVPALPPPYPRAEVTKEGVLISWSIPPLLERAPPAPVSFRLRVYRRQEGSQTSIKLAEVGYAGGLDKLIELVPGSAAAEPKAQSVPSESPTQFLSSFLDQSFEWEKNYLYRVTVATAIAEPGKPEVTVEGDDSSEVKVFAHDIFPPAMPSSLQAVFAGPGQRAFIDLIWAPVTDVDLDGYNVYRHEDGAAAVKLNAEPLKTPAYRDERVEAGKKYFYSVSAVDVRGNESALSDEASESVP